MAVRLSSSVVGSVSTAGNMSDNNNDKDGSTIASTGVKDDNNGWQLCDISYNQLRGIYPNSIGAGLAEGGRVSAYQLLHHRRIILS
jgi:hypothetical protein